MTVDLYLDANCGNCTEYINELKFYCELLGHDLNIIDLDDDYIGILKKVRELMAHGIKVEYFPFLIIGKTIYHGILSKDEVEHIISNI